MVSTGLSRGAVASVSTNLGILGANVVYIAVSVAGLGAVMAASVGLFLVLKWVGAAFLIYLGVRMLLARRGVLEVPAAQSPEASPASLFLRGFVSQIVNPKAVIFYGALFPQFLTPGGNLRRERAAGRSSEVVESSFVILFGYGALASQGARLANGRRFALFVDRTAGMLLIGAGLGLAAVRRS